MIEKIIFDYLNRPGWSPAFMEVPESPPATPYYVIQKTSGGEIEGHVGSAVLAIQSYGATLYEAASANEALKAEMAAATELPEIARCRLNSDYNYTDTRKRKYRYQAVFEITHY